MKIKFLEPTRIEKDGLCTTPIPVERYTIQMYLRYIALGERAISCGWCEKYNQGLPTRISVVKQTNAVSTMIILAHELIHALAYVLSRRAETWIDDLVDRYLRPKKLLRFLNQL